MPGVYGLLPMVLENSHLITSARAEVSIVAQIVTMPTSTLFFLHTEQKITTAYLQVVEAFLRKLSIVR